jgi:hypothetical protein
VEVTAYIDHDGLGVAMHHGQLVSLPGYSRKGIVLRVTLKDIKTSNVQVRRPGLYVFSGYWYGTNPLDFNSYGKIHHHHGRRLGTISKHQQAKKFLS